MYVIAWNRNYDGCQRALASMVYKYFEKKRLRISVNEQLTEDLQKPLIQN